MASLINWIKEKKELDIYAFYDEIPIKVKIEIHDIDYEKEQIVWSFNQKLEFALSKSKELYLEYNGTIYVMSVIIYNKEEMVTTFPTVAVEPKLKRRYIRVNVDEDDQIYVIVNGIKTKAWDISEKGVGIVINNIENFKLSEKYEMIINIDEKEFKVLAELVYMKEIGKISYKLGFKFIKSSPVLEDKIFKYILKKQKDILKKISMFRD